MVIRITDCSDYAFQFLNAPNQRIRASIHSIYRNTINIVISKQLLAVQTRDTILSPISFLADADANDFYRLQQLLRPGDTIFFDDYFSLHDIKTHNCALKCGLSNSQRTKLQQQLNRILSDSDSGGFDLFFQDFQNFQDFQIQDHQNEPVLPLHLEAARKKITDGWDLYQQKCYDIAAETLTSLVGLGTGLTPSGDDFLCGVLAGLILSDQKHSIFSQKLKSSIANQSHRTVDISQEFLRLALQDQFSLPVLALTASSDSSDDTKNQTLESFRKIGHSSGMDTLCGIYFSLLLSKAEG